MASLITSEEAAALTGIFNDIFDTFKREIVVWKEPIKTVATINESYLYGYGDPSNLINYTSSPVSGVHSAVIKYTDEMESAYDSNVTSYLPEGEARIKVQTETKDFIEKGKTERIDFDGKSFNVTSEVTPKMFLQNEFWVYHLREIK